MPSSSDPDADPNEPEEDLRRRSFVADSNARLKLKASVRRPKKALVKATTATTDASDNADADDNGDGPEATIEGVLVLAEEAMEEDEIDMGSDNDNDDNDDNPDRSTAVSSEPASPSGSTGSAATPSRHSICLTIDEDTAPVDNGRNPPQVAEPTTAAQPLPEAASAAPTPKSASKSLDQRLRLGKAPVELTEAETQRFIELGLMADPKAEVKAKAMEKSRIYNALNPALLYSGQTAGTEKVRAKKRPTLLVVLTACLAGRPWCACTQLCRDTAGSWQK